MPAASAPLWEIEHQGAVALVRLQGEWLVQRSGLRMVDELRRVLAAVGDATRLRLDATGLARWDSALVVFVRALQGAGDPRRRPLEVDVSGLPDPLQKLLSLAGADHGIRVAPDGARGVSLPDVVRARIAAVRAQASAIAELVGLTILSVGTALRGRLLARPADVIALMREAGASALAIVTVVNSLTGAILAFVGGVQLERFGAGLYSANLVGVAVVREMAPIMTAIVMAGRTGGAYAAHIATMEGNEEIDALQVLGIPPYQYLVVPRIAALVAMMPLLYFYGCLVGLAGGMLVSLAMTGMSPVAFIDQLRVALLPKEFYLGLMKSICFGAFVALSSCRVGLQAGRSAAEVGRAATSAVVAGIVGIIALDAIFAACANVLGL